MAERDQDQTFNYLLNTFPSVICRPEMQQCFIPARGRLRVGTDAARGEHPSPARRSGEQDRERHGETRVCRGAGIHRPGRVRAHPAAVPRGHRARGEGELRGRAGHAGVREQYAVPVRRRIAPSERCSVTL